MPELVLQIPRDPIEVEAYAERYDYSDGSRAAAAGSAAQRRGWYTRDEFLVVCRWKAARAEYRYADNSEDAIEAATRSAFATSNEAKRITELLRLRVSGYPSLPTLLHFAWPGDYPILDVRALESAGWHIEPGRRL